jgi:hypothetical protein
MTLNEFCKDSWIETEDGYYVSKHCCKEKIDLYSAIAQWQNKKLSPSENDTLVKCLICGVFANRRIWREVKEKLLFICPTRYDWENGVSECFQILVERNLFYLLSFDLEKVRDRDNENVMKLLSVYIARCLYPREILRIYLGRKFEEIGDEYDLLPGSVLIIKPEILEKISADMFSMFEKACVQSPMYVFIHESVINRKYRSDTSRRQKSNLKKYIAQCLTEKEHQILDPSHAGMITDYIEECLADGDEHPLIIRLREEHETAIERIISVFEEARNLFKLDNFISEILSGDEPSPFSEIERNALKEYIRANLGKVIENITYLKKVTPGYIVDEIERMIAEGKISVSSSQNGKNPYYKGKKE